MEKYGRRWGRMWDQLFHEDPLGSCCCARVLCAVGCVAKVKSREKTQIKVLEVMQALCVEHWRGWGMEYDMYLVYFSRIFQSNLMLTDRVAVTFAVAAALQLLLSRYPVRVLLSSWRSRE